MEVQSRTDVVGQLFWDVLGMPKITRLAQRNIGPPKLLTVLLCPRNSAQNDGTHNGEVS